MLLECTELTAPAQRHRGARVAAVSILAGTFAGSILLSGFLIYWMGPSSLAPMPGAYDLLLSQDVKWLGISAACWIGVSALITAYEVVRLGGSRRSEREYPFSAWRTVKSALFVFGWCQLGALWMWAFMTSGIGNVVDTATLEFSGSRLIMWLVLAGLVSLLSAASMMTVDVVRRDNSQ